MESGEEEKNEETLCERENMRGIFPHAHAHVQAREGEQ